ncbi:MAG: response regulator [Cellvibrionaceae bacterium]
MLWNFNENAVSRAIEAEVNNSFIEAITIKVDEKIEYQITKPWKKSINDSLTKAQLNTLSNIVPIDLNYSGDDGEGLVGKLLIIPSYEEVEFELKTLAKRLLLQNIILNISLGFLIILILYKLVIHPINKTNSGLNDIVNEGNDLSIRLDENNIGELGELSKNYNKLAEYVSLTLEERKEALEKSEESAKLKSEFLASMSHEIRTPMNGVLGTLDLMLKGELNEQQQHYTHLAKSSADSLLVIINDILDFSKIEAGKLEIENIDFDLPHLMGEIAESIAMKAQEKGLELILDTAEVNLDKVKGDPNRIRQIMNNIIGNAIKFTSEGEVLIKASIKDFDDQYLQFNCDVIDTGIGIPEEKQTMLFNSFSQVDASTTREYGGTGLGLAIVNQLCVLMDGSITINSKPGNGSQFTISLALEKSSDANTVKPSKNITDKNIVILGKNKNNLKTLANQLSCWEINSTTFKFEEELLNHIKNKENNIDLIIIDMEFSEEKQRSLFKKLETVCPEAKKIIMTTMVNKGDSNLFKELNILGSFSKPIKTEDWFNIFTLAFDKKQKEPEKNNNNIAEHEPNENSKSILLVEDNLINQQIAVANLEMLGFQVDIAENGLEAIDKLKQSTIESRYNLVFMDCQMPEMDGYQATKAIRKGKADNTNLGKTGVFSGIPIVAMTANAMKGDREKCIAAGMDDYMSKPIDPDELQEKLHKWLH